MFQSSTGCWLEQVVSFIKLQVVVLLLLVPFDVCMLYINKQFQLSHYTEQAYFTTLFYN